MNESDIAMVEGFDDFVQRGEQIFRGGKISYIEHCLGGAGLAPPLDVNDHIHMQPTFQQQVRTLRTNGRAFRVRFHNMDVVEDVEDFLLRVSQEVQIL